MRMSQLVGKRFKERPAEASLESHAFLLRGGYARQVAGGIYSLLPPGLRVVRKIERIIRQEMDRVGGQEVLMPVVLPRELWEESGRYGSVGSELVRFADRTGHQMLLGMTHEEIFSVLATELKSYKELPQIWYQIQTKFRDEPRPKSGLLRVREFAMKDSYSFDLDEAGLDASFDLHHDAYVRIFERLGLDAMPVQASSGSMGGSASIEFMVESPAGEDDVVRCRNCGYQANVERGTSTLLSVEDAAPLDAPERFPTPGVRTIAALEEIEGGAAADRQIKTMVMVLDGEVTLALVRGDHQLNLQKLQDHTGAIDLRPAEPEETVEHLGAHPGSLGAVSVADLKIVADHALQGRTSMTTGANEDDWHYRGVDIERDIAVDDWADLREVQAGEACPQCSAPLEIVRCIEAGHIFKLGRKYAEALGVSVLDENGSAQVPTMGSYGIGVGRNVAAIAENHHDERGLVWPVEVAPFQVVVTVMSIKDDRLVAEGERLYSELRSRGLDVLLDDRDARAGVKFADAELIGIPFRITVGARGLDNGELELTPRASGETEMVPVGDVVERVIELVRS